MIIDLHCDTLCELAKHPGQALRHNHMMVDLERMKDSGYLCQCFAIYTNLEEERDPLAHAKRLASLWMEEMERNRNLISPAISAQDILNNNARGKMSGLLTIEEGAYLKDINTLHEFYDMGVRMVALSWNYDNGLTHPNVKEGEDPYTYRNTTEGLTELGKTIVREMTKLGMVVDVSHMSDACFYDVAEIVDGPFVASHSNARALCPHARNLSDDMMRVIRDHDGVVGVNFYGPFLRQGDETSRVEDMVRHISCMRDVMGIRHIALGSDFDGIDGKLELSGAGEMDRLLEALRKAGFSRDEILDLTQNNALRVFREIIK